MVYLVIRLLHRGKDVGRQSRSLAYFHLSTISPFTEHFSCLMNSGGTPDPLQRGRSAPLGRQGMERGQDCLGESAFTVGRGHVNDPNI